MTKLEQACLGIFKTQCPYRTGTLQGNLRVNKLANGFEIVSDLYYMPYTEEKWEYNSGWGYTGVNPNEGWFKQAFEMCLRLVGNAKGVEFKRES